jgi:threonine synthase
MFGIPGGISYTVDKIKKTTPGIWQYRESFGLPADAPEFSLGEGSTPLVPTELFGMQVWLKMESANPTGSYKDRLAAPLVSLLAAYGIREAVEDSSGNAGAAFAAYTARAGIKARVFVPESASGPKRAQIEAYGAEIVAVPGPRPEATKEALRVVKNGVAYGSHALVPHGLAGIATIAYELAIQMNGEVPTAVLIPAGHGGLLLGVILGFQALHNAGQIEHLPHFIGIQAENNAPLWAAASGQDFVPRPTTAGGIAVQQPARKGELLMYAHEGLLEFVTVSEDEISEGYREFAQKGFYMEPTSAVVWGALKQIQGRIQGDVVAIISGHGLKAG